MAPMHRPRAPRPATALAAALLAWALGAAFLSAGLVSSARAQGSDWAISFGAGFAKPTGGIFGEEWKQGSSVMLTMAGLMNPKFELGGEFGYVKFEPSGDSIHVPGIAPGENEWEMWRIRLRARRFFASSDAKVAPFAIAGIGIYPTTAQSTDSTGTLKVTQTGSGVSIGAGVDYRAGDTVHFGLEGQYHYIRTNSAVLGYKAAPTTEVLFVIRWIPGGAE